MIRELLRVAETVARCGLLVWGTFGWACVLVLVGLSVGDRIAP